MFTPEIDVIVKKFTAKNIPTKIGSKVFIIFFGILTYSKILEYVVEV